MFDTHCHLNFRTFDKNFLGIIDDAKVVGVGNILIPGTNLETSVKAVEIAGKFEDIFAAVGIHPHHLFEFRVQSDELRDLLQKIEGLLDFKKVMAVGEIGLDKYVYRKTRYKDYIVDDNFFGFQKNYLIEQIKLAIKYKKSLIIHNRQATDDLLQILNKYWDKSFEYHMVLHCCEANIELLKFAKKKKIFIGVDGDVTYDKNKLEFIETVPQELLVLETDSPFLTPEPIRTSTPYPNVPANLKVIAEFVAKLKGVSIEEIIKITDLNSKKLFGLD